MTEDQNNIEMLIARRVKSARKTCRETQKNCGEILGVSFQQFQKYENGTNRLSAGDLLKISLFFGFPVDFFLQGARAVLTDRPPLSFRPQEEPYDLEGRAIYSYGLVISAIADKAFRDGLIRLAKRHTKICDAGNDN